MGDRVEGKRVAMRPEPADHPRRDRRDVRMPSKWFACKDVTQMNLNRGEPNPQKGVMDRHRCVAVRTGINDDSAGAAGGGLDPVDELALLVGLTKINLKSKRNSRFLAVFLDIGERSVPIDLRFPSAQEVQIGSVQYED